MAEKIWVNMKKMINKLLKRQKHTTNTGIASDSLRITNETVAEHREHILAAGRRFKYPHHYPRHRIVIITVSLVLLLVIGLLSFTAWRLYIGQDTGDLFYSVTQILPIPVASIDGQNVRYSDYLAGLRSAIFYLSTKDTQSTNFSTSTGQHQLDYQKRLALNKAIDDAYAQKLAAQNKIVVTDKEVNSFVQSQIKNNQLGVSESAYRQVLKDYYNWTFEDYLASVKSQLLKVKVMAAIDTTGHQTITSILTDIRDGQDFAALAKNNSQDVTSKSNGGDIGFVALTADDPSGIIKAAAQLQVGRASGVIQGVDGFYIVKLLDKQNNQLHLAKIFVAYTTFDQRVTALRKAGRIKEFIQVPN